MNDRSVECCSGIDRNGLATRMAALAHPARIDIMRELAGLGPCSCKQVVEKFDLAQSTISQHLKVLVDAGLIRHRNEAQRSIYEIDGLALEGMCQLLEGFARQCCADREGDRSNVL